MSRPEMGPYVLLHELAEDALCKIYRAGLRSGNDVEQVVLLCTFKADGEDVRWISETATVGTRALQGLESPHLAGLVDSGVIDGTAFLAYDYVPGTTVSGLLAACREQRTPLPLGLALAIANRCAEGLLAAWHHESRMLHGFLVPPLVLVSNEGEVKVLGFEVASRLRRLLARRGVHDELAAYLAPEVVAEGQPATTDDVYSLGALLFDLTTGFAPPRSEPELTRALESATAADGGELPDELRNLLTTSLVGPSRRATLEDWAEALGEIILSGRYETSSFDLAFFSSRLLGHDFDSATDVVATGADPESAARAREEALAKVQIELHEGSPATAVEKTLKKQGAILPETDAFVADSLERELAAPAPEPASTAASGYGAEEPGAEFAGEAAPNAASRNKALAIAAAVVAVILGGLGAAFYFTTNRGASVSPSSKATSSARPATQPSSDIAAAGTGAPGTANPDAIDPGAADAIAGHPGAADATAADPGGDPGTALASPSSRSPETAPLAGTVAGRPSTPAEAQQVATGPASSEDIERRVQQLVSKRSATIEAALREKYAQQIASLEAQLEAGQQAAATAADDQGTATSAPRAGEQQATSTGTPPEPAATATGESFAPSTRTVGGTSGIASSRLTAAMGEPTSSTESHQKGPAAPPSRELLGKEPIDDPPRLSSIGAIEPGGARGTADASEDSRNVEASSGPSEAEPKRERVRKGDIVTPGPGVEPPTLKKSVQPRYPPIARRLGKEAVITLRVLVDENGRAVDIEQLGEKAGYGFDEEALQAVKEMIWTPATKDDVAVRMWSTLRLAFKL